MKLRALLTVGAVLLVVAPVIALAQVNSGSSQSSVGVPPSGILGGAVSKPGLSLLDPSRFHMRNSYTMSYFSSGGRQGSVGLYMSTLEYQLSRPLTVRIGLGYLHQPLGFVKNMGGPGEGRILPNVSLDFRPSDKFHFILDFRTIPTGEYRTGFGQGGYSPYPGSRDYWDW